MTDPTANSAEAAGHSTASAVHALLQFLRVVRYRKNVMVSCLVAAALLGGLYFATAIRRYQAKASLLVLQTGVDVTNTTMTAEGVHQGLMPTYERLFMSAVVLDGAIKYLTPADRVDLEQIPTENWPVAVRNNLSASTVRLTNIIEISYRSKSPRAAVAVVNAVLRSYLEFMDKTHKGTAGELINVFTKEKSQLEERLTHKQQEVLTARQRFGDLGINADSHVVHPMVQRVIGLNEGLIKAQQYRLETQATMQALQSAVRNGEDLQHHMMALESTVGREFLLSGLGFNSRDVVAQANMEKTLLEDQAALRTMQSYYGPNHPKLLQISNRIRATENYLANYQTRTNERMSQMRDKQLGSMLVGMLQQRLTEALQHEASLRASFEQARSEAVQLIGERERLTLLEHDLKFLRDLRDVLLNKIASVDLRQDHGDIRTAIVSEPVLPKTPVWPKLPLVAVICLASGVGSGLCVVYLLDVLDDRFRSPEELRLQLGVPVLAMVRKMEALNAQGLAGIQAHVAPDAVTSEAFRTLRTSLAFANCDTGRLIMSSAEPGDGKTTVIANLAASFQQAGKRTLLVDADMRRPGLSAQMGLKGQSGLSDLLSSEQAMAQLAPICVRSLGLEGLDFLPAGPRRSNPAELLGGPRLAELLSWADSHYDQILIDSPPALAATDASIIGQLVDGLIVVVHPKKNQRKLVVRATESLTALGVTVLGVVLNQVGNEQGSEYGYGYGYGYGYSSDDAAPSDGAQSTLAMPDSDTTRRAA